MASSSLLAILLIAVATIQVALATYYSTCDPPTQPEYGGYTPYRTRYYVGSKIEFFCNSGYRRYGPSWSVCREHKKRVFWSHPPPVCKRKYQGLSSVHNVTQGHCVVCVRACEMQKFLQFFHDKMQERNTEECKDRIRVYPCAALRCNERQCEGDAM